MLFLDYAAQFEVAVKATHVKGGWNAMQVTDAINEMMRNGSNSDRARTENLKAFLLENKEEST